MRRGFFGLGRAVLAAAIAASSAVAVAHEGALGPKVHITKAGKCVEDTEYMRRNHMETILHQRDETMHQGIRTSKHSLNKNCINCHADPKTNSVLGPEGFCSSCHTYASVSIDCFSCHSSKPEADKRAAAPVGGAGGFAGLPASARPALMGVMQETGQ